MAVWSSLSRNICKNTSLTSIFTARGSLNISKNGLNTIQVRCSGHDPKTMVITPSRFQWYKFKDLVHYYLMIGIIPCVAVVLHVNIFIETAKLAPIPEGYEPKYWEYYRHPITRFYSRYIVGSPQQEYEKMCHFLFEENEKARLRKLEWKVKDLKAERDDYQAWYYRPHMAKYVRYSHEKMKQLSEHDTQLYRKGGLSGSSALSKDTLGGTTTEGFEEVDSLEGASPHVTRTPTSYLSMPSVKAFPRGARIPEPLNRVLEPISIRHLDADSDTKGIIPQRHHRTNQYQQEHLKEATNKYVKAKGVTRHGSMDGEDPGVIGPIVWDRHCQKLNEIKQDSIDIDENDMAVTNIGKMRKRFNELLDDAFSMFGSRSVSPEDGTKGKTDSPPCRPSENRVHSAIVRPVGDLLPENLGSRPKTSESKRPQTAITRPPKGAWDSPNCRTPARPLSAGPFHKPGDGQTPYIDRSIILVDSELSPNDPAVPLIAAIKEELKKFQQPLPGST